MERAHDFLEHSTNYYGIEDHEVSYGLDAEREENSVVENNYDKNKADMTSESANLEATSANGGITNRTSAVGGTLSLPDGASDIKTFSKDFIVQRGKNFKVHKGGVESFKLKNNIQYNATFSDETEGFNGYRDEKGNVYTGADIFNNVPFYYHTDKYTSSHYVKWLVYSGELKNDMTEYQHSEADSRIVQAALAVGIAKFRRLFRLSNRANDTITALLAAGGATKFTVKKRSVYQYTTAREWYGTVSFNAFNSSYGYVVPTGVSKETQVRAGTAKIQYQLYFQDKLIEGATWTDTLDALTTPAAVDAPTIK